MSIKLLMSLMLVIALLSACSEMNPQSMNMDLAAQNAVSNADHQLLAKHYDDAARDIQTKADAYKKLLAQYESKSYLYGRQAEDLKAHSQKLIDAYEKAAEANLKMAEMHRRQM
ncbi:MAG: hypothetical protein NTY50_17565 [Methylobacter sp.]|nr:hypothetical protein [Methylobacter sp.]